MDQPVHPDHITRLLQNLAPGVGPVGALEPIAVGYSARVLKSSSNLAIRIPRTEHAGARQQTLVSPLRRLAGFLPVSIPRPIWCLPMAPPFPFGIAASSWLPGAPPAAPPSPDVARQVGRFLATMHALEEDTLASFVPWFLGREAIDAERERVMRIALPYLRDLHPPDVIAQLEAWWDDYNTARSQATYTPRLVHGDFWHGNLLVDARSQRLTGVLDWENVAIDDPAQDFATLMHGGGDYTELVMRAYEEAGGTIDDALLERCRWHWEYREFTGIALAIDAGDAPEAQDASRKLREGPLADLFVTRHPRRTP